MKIQRAAVIGAGTMGAGIAQVLSLAGIEVVLRDVSQQFVDAGLTRIKKMYDSRVKKELLTQEKADQLFGLVRGTTNFEDCNNVDLVIEAALETIDVKLEIFKELDRICPSRTILATNTSALSISEIAAATKRPEKVIGMHFFNPAQAMKLVEVIPGIRTANEVTEGILQLCKDLGKVPVRIKECPGFLVNRLLFTYMNEAVWAITEGVATAEEMDKLAVEFGLPMGPFTLFDMTGIDICNHVNEFLYGEYGPRFQPSTLLKQMVKHNFLGQKSGAGFYMHPKGQPLDAPKQLNPELAALIEKARQDAGIKQAAPGNFDIHRLILPMFNEAVYAIQEDVVAPGDVDVAMQWGCGLKRGLLTLSKEKGLKWCLAEIDKYQKLHGERFRSSWLLKQMVGGGLKDFSELYMTPLAVR
jgi:3-hydroxyacyl-CoA dehydrogenase